MSVKEAIAWGITGAGYFLKETFDVVLKIFKVYNVRITTYLSLAGHQVVKIYGLWSQLQQISTGGYLQEILTEVEEGACSPHAGRLLRGVYKALIVSPATGNTVAKVAYGIADTLVTNAIAQAQKGGLPVYIVPTDRQEGYVETTLPCRIERSECKFCKPCPALTSCPYSAIKILDGAPRIDLVLCQSCGLCVAACPFGAIKFGENLKFKVRRVDVENVERLRRMDGIVVLDHPRQIEDVVKKILSP